VKGRRCNNERYGKQVVKQRAGGPVSCHSRFPSVSAHWAKHSTAQVKGVLMKRKLQLKGIDLCTKKGSGFSHSAWKRLQWTQFTPVYILCLQKSEEMNPRPSTRCNKYVLPFIPLPMKLQK